MWGHFFRLRYLAFTEQLKKIIILFVVILQIGSVKADFLVQNTTEEINFKNLFFGSKLNINDHFFAVGTAVIGKFSGAILENKNNEQFFIIEKDEFNILGEIFYIKKITETKITLSNLISQENHFLSFGNSTSVSLTKIVQKNIIPKLPQIDLKLYKDIARELGAPEFILSAIRTAPKTDRDRVGRLGIKIGDTVPILLLNQLSLTPNDIIINVQEVSVFDSKEILLKLKSGKKTDILLEIERNKKLKAIRIFR